MRDLDEGTVVRRAGGSVWSKLQDEIVILDLGSSSYLGLENVGADIWELLDEPIQIGRLEERLLERYDVEPARLRSDVRRFVSDLVERGLVVLDAEDAP